MDTLGTAGPTPEDRTSWNTLFPSVDSSTTFSQGRQTAPAACDGRDGHVLSMSTKAKVILASVAVSLLALVVAIGQFDRFGVYGVGLLLGAALASGYSLRVDGGTLVSWRYGSVRRVPLGTLVRLERYSYRGSVSLRTWKVDGRRGPSIPISGRFFRLSPVAGTHLLRYLDRPDVTWGPGAWEQLSGGMPAPISRGGEPAEITTRSRGPRGTESPAKPLSRWARVGAWFSVVAVGTGAVVLLIVAPVTWGKYFESQRIQHGPETTAVLQREWVTNYSDRYGTHHTTHFDVAFDTPSGRLVNTEMNEPGSWTIEPVGDRLAIKYDPSSPQNAELPGAPANTEAAAIATTVGAGVALVIVGLLTAGFWRARRRRWSKTLALGG